MREKNHKKRPNVAYKASKRVSPTQRYTRYFYIMSVVTFLGVGSTLFFERYQRHRNQKAHNDMYQAVYFFEQEAFEKALYGDDVCTGLLDITRKYRFTKAANLAHFYVGVSYMHQKNWEKAMQHLAKFSTKSTLLRARAWSLMGDALTSQQDYVKAARYYEKAASYKPNKVFTPIYLKKAAIVHEKRKDDAAALHCYQRIIQEFPEATQYGEACKHAARLNVKLGH